MHRLLAAAELLTARLRILQKLQMQCRERGETTIDLNVAELFEPGDLAAIEAFEAAKATALQQAAINLLKLSLDCFNSLDGAGLFTGPGRYGALVGRAEICAVQADNLTRFWALLLKRMQWMVPPKAMDERLVEVLSVPNGGEVLRVLATETTSCITLARMLHDADKATRKALPRDEPAPELPTDQSLFGGDQ